MGENCLGLPSWTKSRSLVLKEERSVGLEECSMSLAKLMIFLYFDNSGKNVAIRKSRGYTNAIITAHAPSPQNRRRCEQV